MMPETAAKHLFSLETAHLLPRLVPTLRDQIQMLFQASLAIFLLRLCHSGIEEGRKNVVAPYTVNFPCEIDFSSRSILNPGYCWIEQYGDSDITCEVKNADLLVKHKLAQIATLWVKYHLCDWKQFVAGCVAFGFTRVSR